MFGNRGPKRRGPKPRSKQATFDDAPPPGGILETVIGIASPRRAAAAAAASTGKPDRRPRLVDLAIEPLALLHAVYGPGAAVDPARVRERWTALRSEFEESAKQLGHRDADVAVCVYALSVALDEAVMSHPDRIGLWLQAGALQLEFHENRELIGGQRFFVRLDELRQQREHAIEALEVLDAILSLGYRGRFVADPAGREALRASLLADVVAVRGEPSPTLAPHAARTEEQKGETLQRLPAWVPPAALAAALLLSWLTVALVTFLHARAVAGSLARL